MTPAMMTPVVDVRRVQRRTMPLLLLSQVLGSIAVTITFAVSGILAVEMSGSSGAASLTQATLTLGAGATSYLLGAWMNRRGRRVGMATGYLVGAIGAGVCVVAAQTDTFPLLVVGTAVLGASSASTNIARYAATDLAPAAHRATTLSVVVWVATVGAVLGPLMVGPAVKVAASLGLPPLTGPFLFDMTCAAIAGLVIFALMRPDPLLFARQSRYLETPPETRTETPTETPTAARTSRLGGVAPTAAALVLAHATMTAVMVMTPLEMHHHGATHSAIGAAISVHFLGMCAFSPLSGLLADRVGVRPALVTGAAILIASLLVLAGLIGPPSITHAFGLFLLGLGGSVCTVAASSHIAAHSAGDTRVQGSTDTAMTIVSAGAALAAGPLMAIWGFTGLLVLAAAFCAGVLLSAPRIRPLPNAKPRDEEPLEAAAPDRIT